METLKPRTESLNFRTKAGSLPRNPFRSHLFPNILCVLNVQLVQSLDVIVHESNRNQQQVLVAAFYHSCTQERMGEKSKQKCKLIVQYILQNSGLMSFYISLPNYGLCWKKTEKNTEKWQFLHFLNRKLRWSPLPLMVFSVPGSSQGRGPTFDCQTRRKGLVKPSSFMTNCTVAPISAT